MCIYTKNFSGIMLEVQRIKISASERMEYMKLLLGFICALSLLTVTNTLKAKDMDSLDQREKSIATVAAYSAMGDIQKLKQALAQGLDCGVTVAEFKEVLVQTYAYCGFPRSLNALGAYMELLKERGGKDAKGASPGPLPAGKSIDFGAENQTKLVGAPVKGELFEFAPAIDEFLKAHLFGDIFGRDNLDWKTREIATIAMLASMDGVESQLNSHIKIGLNNGVNSGQVSEILKIAADARGMSNTSAFAFGKENTAYARYFTGKSWLAPLTSDKSLGVPISNVTFEPACRNNWHSHSQGQILIVTGGVGYYQEKGKPARKLKPGDIVEIHPDVVHWHGAAPDSWFSHLAVECNPKENKNTWLEAVSDKEYAEATRE